MNGSSVTKYLRTLCGQLDSGLDMDTVRRVALTLSVPAIVLSPACMVYGAPEYGVPFEEVESDCSNAEDDDWDGRVDCEDDDCRFIERCISCFDGVDNDGNDSADCSDPSCMGHEGCNGECDDGEDNDGDGLTDCRDPDCSTHQSCM